VPAALSDWLPPDAFNILLVLSVIPDRLGREEHKSGAEQYAFGGVRNVSADRADRLRDRLPVGAPWCRNCRLRRGRGVLLLSYSHQAVAVACRVSRPEMAGLITYVVGALVFHQYFWIATP